MGCFSFYANKIITTGEGGMVTTDDDRLAERLRLLRNLAFGKPRFLHQEAGFNFRMTGYQAAMGRVQLRKIERIIEQKRRVAHAYTSQLADVPGIRTPVELEWARNVYWMYAIEVTDEFPLKRDELASPARRGRDRVADVLLPDEHAAVPAASAGIPPRPVPGRREAVEDGPLPAVLDHALRRGDLDDRGTDSRARPCMNTYTGLHARHYDVVYRDKPYADEARFVDSLLREAGVARGRLLDIACGTGRHAGEFVALGWDVTGVDLSDELLEHARLNAPTARFERQDMRELDVKGGPFDAVTCLFDSIGYALDDDGRAGDARRRRPPSRRRAERSSSSSSTRRHSCATRPRSEFAGSPSPMHGDELVRISRTRLDEHTRRHGGRVRAPRVARRRHLRPLARDRRANRFFSVTEMRALLERAGLAVDAFRPRVSATATGSTTRRSM